MRTHPRERKGLDVLKTFVSEGSHKRSGSQAGATVMLPVTPRAGAPSRHNRWGVVLAGGDGVRLRPLTRVVCGDDRPKQFCPLVDGETPLAQTLRRTELTISRAQILISLNGQHCKWYLQEPGHRGEQCIVQPVNKGTAPAVAHALLSIAQIDQHALVAIFPADHHYSDEQLFASALESAFESAAQPLETATRLLRQGSVWNTFVSRLDRPPSNLSAVVRNRNAHRVLRSPEDAFPRPF